MKLYCEKMHPDAIFFHDDWGTKTQLFMNPEMWREFFKEPYRKIYGYIRSQGVIAIHHADSYLAPIVEDMAEIGIQCWQGVLPENNIPELQQRLQGRMILMGGIGAAIDTPDSTEEEIRAMLREILHLVREEGLRLRDIAVVPPSAEEFEYPLIRAFELYGLGSFLDNKTNVTSHPFAQLILQALAGCESDFSENELPAMLKTGLTALTPDE